MKKIIYIFIFLFSTAIFSQRNGMSYQALIMNPLGEQIPGYNNSNNPLLDKLICLKFSILDNNGSIEYSETQTVTTDGYGMVNLTIGNGSKVQGYANTWDEINWGPSSKELKVFLDSKGTCSSFLEISNQFLSSVPFAMYAASAGSIKTSKRNDNDEIWNNAVYKLKKSRELLDLKLITKKEYEKISIKLKKIILKSRL